MKDASADELAEVEGFGAAQAGAVFEFFHRGGTEPESVEEDEGPATGATAVTDTPADAVTEAEIDAALAEDADRAG